jgi:hypothetical protein
MRKSLFSRGIQALFKSPIYRVAAFKARLAGEDGKYAPSRIITQFWPCLDDGSQIVV